MRIEFTALSVEKSAGGRRRRNTTVHVPFVISEVCAERVYEIKFLGTYITEDLPWPSNIIVIVKKPQLLLYLLRIFTKKKNYKGI